jgi:CheY-like chemotaxis protein
MKNVLLVDDNQDNCNLLIDILNDQQEISFVTVDNGYKAIEILKKRSFDFVITDYYMGSGDGGTLGFYCKENKIPCVVFTGVEVEDVRSFIPQEIEIIPKGLPSSFECLKTFLNTKRL